MHDDLTDSSEIRKFYINKWSESDGITHDKKVIYLICAIIFDGLSAICFIRRSQAHILIAKEMMKYDGQKKHMIFNTRGKYVGHNFDKQYNHKYYLYIQTTDYEM